MRAIRAHMAAQGIKVPELALRTGIKKQNLYDRFSGRTAMDLDDLEKIAVALGTTAVALLRDIDEVLHASRWTPARPGQDRRHLERIPA